MTDTPGDPRAEQAFRDAFRQQADRLEPDPLPVVRRRRRWPVLVAAAAVVVLVGAGVLVAPDDPPSSGPAPSTEPGTTPDRSPTAADDPAADDPAGEVAAESPLAEPEPGWRWVSWRGAAVQVPADWGYDVTPQEAWCTLTRASTPREPYVAQDTMGLGVSLVGCIHEGPSVPAGFGPGPERLWTPHVSFVDVGVPAWDGAPTPDGVTSYRGWTVTARTVGDVQVQVLTDEATADVAAPAVASLRAVDVDQNGCATRSAVTAEKFVRPPDATDLSAVTDVRAVAVCRYARDTEGLRPGLVASRSIEGAAAQDLVDAVVAGPIGGGPDRPENCVADMYGDTAIVLRVTDGTGAVHDAFVYYDWCFGNGIDDGTHRYGLTEASCRPLFAEPPVQLYSGSSHIYRICAS